MPVLIPETYVADLPVRLGLYRRIGALVDRREIEAFAAELIDRFGPLPEEVENLLEIIAIKRLCREAGVEKVEAGAEGRGARLPRQRASPIRPGWCDFLQSQAGTAKLRPDQRLVHDAQLGRHARPAARHHRAAAAPRRGGHGAGAGRGAHRAGGKQTRRNGGPAPLTPSAVGRIEANATAGRGRVRPGNCRV